MKKTPSQIAALHLKKSCHVTSRQKLWKSLLKVHDSIKWADHRASMAARALLKFKREA